MRFIILLVVLTALVGCQKRPVTYYRGLIPDYRMSPDGRYYPIDAYGRFAALSMDYREQTNDGLYYYPCPIEGAEPPPMYGTAWLSRKQQGKIPDAFKAWQGQIEQAMRKETERPEQEIKKTKDLGKVPVVLQGQSCPLEPVMRKKLERQVKEHPGQVITIASGADNDVAYRLPPELQGGPEQDNEEEKRYHQVWDLH